MRRIGDHRSGQRLGEWRELRQLGVVALHVHPGGYAMLCSNLPERNPFQCESRATCWAGRARSTHMQVPIVFALNDEPGSMGVEVDVERSATVKPWERVAKKRLHKSIQYYDT